MGRIGSLWGRVLILILFIIGGIQWTGTLAQMGVSGLSGIVFASEGSGRQVNLSGFSPVLALPLQAGAGQPFLVRLTSRIPFESVSVSWMGREVEPSFSVWENRHVALAMLGTEVGKVKTGTKNLLITARTPGKTHNFRRMVKIITKAYPRQDLTLPPKMVTPPASLSRRIKSEGKLTANARNTLSSQRYWTLPFVRPVEGGFTSLYGLKRYLNNIPKNPHRGLDFRSGEGNPVKAASGGVVILVGDHYYAGTSVYIDHGNGVVSMYFHLQNSLVREGDKVIRGQVIGRSGRSGRVTGPHLHFSVSVQGSLVDPKPLLEKTADQLLGQAP